MPKEYNDAIAYDIENTIHTYNTIERDLFIENFDLDYNLDTFTAFYETRTRYLLFDCSISA